MKRFKGTISRLVLLSVALGTALPAFAKTDGPDTDLFGDFELNLDNVKNVFTPTVVTAPGRGVSSAPAVALPAIDNEDFGSVRLKDYVPSSPPKSASPAAAVTSTSKTTSTTVKNQTPTAAIVKTQPATASVVKSKNADPAPQQLSSETAATVKQKDVAPAPQQLSSETAATVKEKDVAPAPQQESDETAATVKQSAVPTAATVKGGTKENPLDLGLTAAIAKGTAANGKCAKQQEPGSVGGLMALGARLPKAQAQTIDPLGVDIDESKIYEDLSHDPLPARGGKKASVPATKLMKNLDRTMLEEVRRPRSRRGVLISDPKVAKFLCLQGVRMALQRAAGIKPHTWTSSAKNAGPFIVRELKFKKAPAGKYNSHNVPFGAVLIYDDPSNSRAHGHIEIRGSNGYYSDFYSKLPIDDPAKAGKRRRLIGVYLPPGVN